MLKKWLVGITGGIAAYKTPELVRLLRKQGSEVRVVLSPGAKAFVAAMTLQAVSGNPVYSELLDADFEAAMGHIELARWADGILIAPLSANRLAALALGMADDLLTTLCLATTAPIVVAPAMNQKMWHHPATQTHIQTLQNRGIQILGPDWGEQACGEIGLGRMLEPENIISRLSIKEEESSLKDVKIVITAGPTREWIDPVRFLSNRSSGKMGFALAQQATQLGAKVTLVSGPVSLVAPAGVERIDVTSANEMLEVVLTQCANCDIFICAAAVADFAPEKTESHKIKKEIKQGVWELKLQQTPDILATISKAKQKPYCVGFAAETESFENHAKKKLQDKHLDLIVVNDVSQDDIGFDVEYNALTVYSHDTKHSIPKQTKQSAALTLLKIISERYHAKNTIENFR